MDDIATVLRRTLWLVLLAAVGAVTWVWWRDRSGPGSPPAPAQWPPLTPVADSARADTAPARAGAPPVAATETWIAPSEDGSVPATHVIKANATSRIYHLPGGRFYERTNPDRWYATEADAQADGYRRSKS